MSEWNRSKIEELCYVGRGRVISQFDLEDNADYPVYSSQTSNDGIMGYLSTFDFDGEYVTWTTDGANAGTVFHRFGKFNCTNVCGTLLSKGQVYPLFLSKQLGFIAKRYVSYVGNPKLMNNIMAKIEIEYPMDINEQKKISQVLTTVDTAIIKTNSIIKKYEAIKEGLLQDLLANGIDENGVIRSQKTHEYKDSPLGKIPVEWNDTTVKLNFKLRARIGWQGLKASEFIEDGPFVVTGTDFELGKINWDNCYHVSYKRYEQDAGIQLHDGDLVITKDGTIGKTAFITDCPSQTTLNSGVFVIRPKNNGISSKYFYYILNSRYFEQFMRNYLTGSTIKHLNQEIFYDMVIVVPKHIDEQNRIVNKLDSIQNAIYKEIEHLKKYDQIKQGLLQDLLTHKVSVEPLLERSVENE